MAKYIHFGADDFNPEQFKAITNHGRESLYDADAFNKPEPGTGFWACPADSEYNWKDFESQNSRSGDGRDMDKAFSFDLAEDAKILHIDSLESMEAVYKDYPLKGFKRMPGQDLTLGQLEGDKSRFRNAPLNFQKISKDYDAVEVTISKDRDFKSAMDGWDIDSLLVFNPSVMENIEPYNEIEKERDSVTGLDSSEDELEPGLSEETQHRIAMTPEEFEKERSAAEAAENAPEPESFTPIPEDGHPPLQPAEYDDINFADIASELKKDPEGKQVFTELGQLSDAVKPDIEFLNICINGKTDFTDPETMQKAEDAICRISDATQTPLETLFDSLSAEAAVPDENINNRTQIQNFIDDTKDDMAATRTEAFEKYYTSPTDRDVEIKKYMDIITDPISKYGDSKYTPKEIGQAISKISELKDMSIDDITDKLHNEINAILPDKDDRMLRKELYTIYDEAAASIEPAQDRIELKQNDTDKNQEHDSADLNEEHQDKMGGTKDIPWYEQTASGEYIPHFKIRDLPIRTIFKEWKSEFKLGIHEAREFRAGIKDEMYGVTMERYRDKTPEELKNCFKVVNGVKSKTFNPTHSSYAYAKADFLETYLSYKTGESITDKTGLKDEKYTATLGDVIKKYSSFYRTNILEIVIMDTIDQMHDVEHQDPPDDINPDYGNDNGAIDTDPRPDDTEHMYDNVPDVDEETKKRIETVSSENPDDKTKPEEQKPDPKNPIDAGASADTNESTVETHISDSAVSGNAGAQETIMQNAKDTISDIQTDSQEKITEKPQEPENIPESIKQDIDNNKNEDKNAVSETEHTANDDTDRKKETDNADSINNTVSKELKDDSPASGDTKPESANTTSVIKEDINNNVEKAMEPEEQEKQNISETEQPENEIKIDKDDEPVVDEAAELYEIDQNTISNIKTEEKEPVESVTEPESQKIKEQTDIGTDSTSSSDQLPDDKENNQNDLTGIPDGSDMDADGNNDTMEKFTDMSPELQQAMDSLQYFFAATDNVTDDYLHSLSDTINDFISCAQEFSAEEVFDHYQEYWAQDGIDTDALRDMVFNMDPDNALLQQSIDIDQTSVTIGNVEYQVSEIGLIDQTTGEPQDGMEDPDAIEAFENDVANDVAQTWVDNLADLSYDPDPTDIPENETDPYDEQNIQDLSNEQLQTNPDPSTIDTNTEDAASDDDEDAITAIAAAAGII